MKKYILVFVLVLSLFSVGMTAMAKENDMITNENDVIRKEVVYDTWEDARENEYIDEGENVLKFKSAYRVENTDMFVVTYDSDY